MNRTTYCIALLLAGIVPAARAQDVRNVSATPAEQTFFDYQVEQAVRIKVARPPVYPERLRAANVDGSVLVQFVVDERGNAVMNTFKVVKSTDAELTTAVRQAVSASVYFPAEIRGQKVKQLVQQPFTFTPGRR